VAEHHSWHPPDQARRRHRQSGIGCLRVRSKGRLDGLVSAEREPWHS
jgi:hypothetical protein